jgi:VIT1/CCC1 family predicted Fe2+/Mn2+ transporter
MASRHAHAVGAATLPVQAASLGGHRIHRAAWLRAAVLGADDGIVSVASVMMGVAAAGTSRATILTAAVAATVAGAMAMAAGEYVSVSSQRDTERADLALEERELAEDPDGERAELAALFQARGLPPGLADQVAAVLSDKDALAAHARDELGLHETMRARPVQAGLSSAASFFGGAALPLLAMLMVPASLLVPAVVLSALAALVLLGVAGAVAGGAPMVPAAVRVGLGGGFAIAVTAGVGHLMGHGGM